MKILIVSQYFWPENFRVNDLVSELVRRGHEVTVLTGEPNYPDGAIFAAYRHAPHEFATYAGARIVRVPLVARGSSNLRLVLNYLTYAISASVLGAWRLRNQHFDAIFVFQASPVTAALPAVLLRRLKRAPIALWVLDLWPESLTAVGVIGPGRTLRAVAKLVSFIYGHSDLVLAQSMAFMPIIERYAPKDTNVRYFPGWAEGLFDASSDEAPPAPELAPHSDAFKIVFTGNIGEAQDFPAILEAAELLRHETRIHWLIVGDGRAAASVKAEIARRVLGSTVFMLGRHPLERMPSFFRAADALLVTLRQEPIFAMTIPGKVQTYLTSGRPLLGMIDGEGARVIEESGAGYVAPAGQSQELARLALELSHLPQAERKAMAMRARRYAAAEFDRATLITRLESWLAELPRPPAG